MENYKQFIEGEWSKFQEASYNKQPNIMILGRTGSGKSSLVNTVFGRTIAPVSDVEPETMSFNHYQGKDYDSCINLMDSRGYELSDQADTYIQEVRSMVKLLEEDNETLHIVWFTISVAGKRIEEIDLKILKGILEIPSVRGRLGVVLTKCDEDSVDAKVACEFKEILKQNFQQLKVFETSKDANLTLDLESLIEWSANSIDDADVRNSFITAQYRNLELKKEMVRTYVIAYSGGAAVVGFIPIPFADAAILIPAQLTMIAHICNDYGMKNIETLAGGFVSNLVVTQIAKSLATNLVKFIPIIGTWVGGTVNAAVASSITLAMGMTVSELCHKACKDVLEGKSVDVSNIFTSDAMKDLFEKYYQQYETKK